MREVSEALADELAEPALAMLADELALAMLLTGIAWGKSRDFSWRASRASASNVSWRASASNDQLSSNWPVLHEGSSEALADELAELALAMFKIADESVADELVLAMLADELALAMTSWSRIPRIFQERIMGAGTALGLYNVSLQYQQHNASHANCISSSAEHKEDSKTQNLNDFQLWASFLELSRNHRCALSRKLWGVEKSGVYQYKNCDTYP